MSFWHTVHPLTKHALVPPRLHFHLQSLAMATPNPLLFAPTLLPRIVQHPHGNGMGADHLLAKGILRICLMHRPYGCSISLQQSAAVFACTEIVLRKRLFGFRACEQRCSQVLDVPDPGQQSGSRTASGSGSYRLPDITARFEGACALKGRVRPQTYNYQLVVIRLKSPRQASKNGVCLNIYCSTTTTS